MRGFQPFLFGLNAVYYPEILANIAEIMREPPLRKTWEYSNITQHGNTQISPNLISYERGWTLACLEDLIKPNQASHQGAR
jgi:hypothetical protein